jgi:A/G-specific adenine glycosylase
VLRTFPGIGEATAAEIAAFAYHVPTVFIETNIRRVFIHSFFPYDEAVKDREILPLIEQTLDRSDPRNWYYALMDYGVMLNQGARNPNRRSAHYQKQSPFHGSNRQLRGMILKALITERSLSEEELVERTGKNEEQVRANLGRLQQEGFVREKGAKYSIA